MDKDLPYAEDINYWKTGKSSPDVWLEKCERIITQFGGRVQTYAFGIDHGSGRQAYMFAFEIKGDFFKIVYPVLPTKYDDRKDELAARRQAATLLYHHLKAKVLDAEILGHRSAFFSYLVLPDGRTLAEVSLAEFNNPVSLFEQLNPTQIEYKGN